MEYTKINVENGKTKADANTMNTLQTNVENGFKSLYPNLVAVDTTLDEHEEEVVLTKQENLYDKTKIIINTSIDNARGGTYVDNNSFSTDYIDISNLSNIYVSGYSNADKTRLWGAFYNSSKSYVSAISVYDKSYIVNVPSGATYMRLGIINEYKDTLVISKATKTEIYANKEKYTDTLNIGVEPNNSGLWVEHSKNLLLLKQGSLTTNGITINRTLNSFTISGTATATSYIGITGNITFEAGKKYTLSTDKSFTNNFYIYANNTSNIGLTYNDLALKGNNISFTPTKTGEINFSIFVNNAQTLSGTYNLMINTGDKIDYEPYVTPSIKVNNNGVYEIIASSSTNLFTGSVTGSSSGVSVPLSDNVSNYKYLDLDIGVSQTQHNVYRLYLETSNTIQTLYSATPSYSFQFTASVSGTNLTLIQNNVFGWTGNQAKIFKVVGHK